MPPVFTICADCEHRAFRTPRRGKALAEALACLTRLLLARKRLQGLEVVRESCQGNCPLGRICVALHREHHVVEHHLSAEDDPKAVAMRLAGTARRQAGS
ncbi:MAG TPA: hypothetical protein VF768_04800 [Holophagaceae bacterium]